LDTVDNLLAYARTVAINLAFDWRRKKVHRVTVAADDAPEPAANELTPLDRMVKDERLQAVLAATERLNKLYRQVFILRYVEQLSFDQIALETGKTPHHVRALCSRAMNRVRQLCSKIPTPAKGY
jgi:RNA polymerase sigma-70 factor (ECF subfamily)